MINGIMWVAVSNNAEKGEKKHNVNAVFVLHSVHHTAPVGPDLMVHKVWYKFVS